MQRQGQASKREHPHQQGEGQADAGHRHATLPDQAMPPGHGHIVTGSAVQNNVEVAGGPGVARSGREHGGTEHTELARAHGVGAEQRQWCARQEGLHFAQVHLMLPNHAGLADVGLHLAIDVQHIGLNPRVDHHQHGQELLALLAGRPLRVGGRDGRPVLHDVPRQTMRDSLKRFLLMRFERMLCPRAHQQAVSQQQHGQHQRQAGRERPMAQPHVTGPSKR